MTTTMPESITYGKVVGRFILAVGDGTDPDRTPDAKPATGTVTFVATQIVSKEVNIPIPTTVIRNKITCTIDGDGYLIDPDGNRGLWLTVGWHKVSFELKGVSIKTEDILITVDHTDIYPFDLTKDTSAGGAFLTPSQYAELTARINAIETSMGPIVVNGDGTLTSTSVVDNGDGTLTA